MYEDDKAFSEKYNKYQPLEVPGIAVDYIIAYNSWWQPSIVMAEGNKVLHIQVYQDDGVEEIDIDKLAQIYADYLLAEDSATK